MTRTKLLYIRRKNKNRGDFSPRQNPNMISHFGAVSFDFMQSHPKQVRFKPSSKQMRAG